MNLTAILPELLTGIKIKTATLPAELVDATSRGVLWQAALGRFLLDIPEVGRYLVEDGQRVVIDALPQAADEEVIRFFRMAPLAALLYQRNIPVFHAAAAAMPDREECILLAGDSGAGKSTLLVALLQRGWRLLADDLAIVRTDKNGNLAVFPTSPEVVLWSDAVEKLGLTKTDNASGRQVLSWSDRFVNKPLPLCAVYWLAVKNQDGLQISELEGIKRFQAMGLLAYNSHIADALFDPKEYFRQAAVFAQSISLYRLCRSRGCWSADKLADMVEGNIL
ncbi:hypothetical protein [Sporomusa sp. KB1]|jgi:hypothetical protein|uniref:hypothetical protein n=1 Tax=Sporomusa sp. KB1 TaxID=943346 RepID=UPI0011AAF3DE|nr:hypothetical protein [Sporomusa sp. KB1]TWH48804.1 hypothetical protein Salpa_4979 [Sporomusa sp. KB1]